MPRHRTWLFMTSLLPWLLSGCPPTEPPTTVTTATTTETQPRTAPVPSTTADASKSMTKILPYPETRSESAKDTLHGVDVPDPFRWLENVKDPEVQKWMAAEDALARAELAKLPERDAIAKRLKELFYIDYLSAPRHRGDRYFYWRRHATKEKSVVYWKQGKKGEEKVLLDPNTWSEDGSVSLGGWSVSWDGKTVAYTVRKNNADEATMHIMDVESRKERESERIEGAKYATASWTPKGDGFYYTWVTTDPKVSEKDRPGTAELRFHKLGDDPTKDTIVREKTGDPTTFLMGSVSDDGHFLVVNISYGWASNDVFVRDLRDKKGKFVPLAAGRNAHFWTEVYKDQFYVLTDEGAPNWKVVRVDPKKMDPKHWTTVVPEQKDATIDGENGFSVLGGKIAVSYLKNATSTLAIYDTSGKKLHDVALPGPGSVTGPIGRQDEDEAYFVFNSFTTPWEVHALSMKTAKTSVYSKINVPVDPSPYVVEQVFYPSKDGTRVSMFIVRRKDLKKDGSHRTILYGYGGFQINQTSVFTASIYPWLERGGVYAVPNLRGGAEYGEDWHKAGMRTKKQNVFDDFIGAAEYLIQEGYTKSEHLAISGGSNGGLLVGAAMTQRPDLFGAVLCAVPLLDMVRYHQSGSGATWIKEYGSSDDPEDFKALFAYSPYHHVKEGVKYPPTLLLSADSDDRVDPMHARKFAAMLQTRGDGGPVLLRLEKNSGHGGADLTKAEVEKGADRYAFALHYTGNRGQGSSTK